jgi:hypothetical protein
MESIPKSFWVVTGAFVVSVISLALPWVTLTGITVLGVSLGFRHSLNAFQVGPEGVIQLFILFGIAILVSLRMGYRTFTEILPSGPQRDIPNFQLWMLLGCIGIIAMPIIAVVHKDGSMAPGGWIAIISGVVLWLSSLSGYERDY